MYNRFAYQAVMDKYFQKREKNRLALIDKKKNAYKIIPQLETIDKDLAKIASEAVNAAILKNDKKSTDKIIKEFKKKSLELQAQKIELLVTAGFESDYLDEKFSCNKCLDKGYNGINMCECFKKDLRKECYRRTKLSEVINDQNFKSFDLTFYDDSKNSSYGRSSKENMEHIFALCKNYAEKFSVGSENLLFTGSSGLGKTFLTSSISKTIIDKGFYVLYDSAQNIIGRLEKAQFNKGGESVNDDLNELYDCELLIIDDLGAEFKTQYTESAIYNIINTRIISKKSTIVSTNLTPSELTEYYHERIASRLLGDFLALTFFGEDIRTQKLGRKQTKRIK